MMDEDLILISQLNDFIFCPASIYFHNLYGNQDTLSYQKSEQINGKKAHERIDTGLYSSKKNVISGIGVYSEKYGIVGKIDIYVCEIWLFLLLYESKYENLQIFI